MIVLKFGSSVLRCERDLPGAVHEIYRHVREGRRVVAVVSALGGATDALLAEGRGFGEAPAAEALAAHLATGEARAVSLLALAIGRAGLACTPVDAARIGLRTRGPSLTADPVDVNIEVIQRLLERSPAIVVPGFVGVGEDGSATLLGRGGSDLTAVFLAHRLGAQCRLIKDVDGVYTADPNAPGASASRYETLTWEEALRVGGRIVQARALELARDLAVTVEVAQASGAAQTVIGPGPTLLQSRDRKLSTTATAPAPRAFLPPTASATPTTTPLRIGLLGLGVVGLGVYQRLAALPHLFEIVRIAVRDRDKHRHDGVAPDLLTTDPWEVLDDRLDVLVELIGGGKPAAALIEAALTDGRAVVTANKDVVSRHGARLRELCASHGGDLLYSAAAGGSAPVVEAVRRARVSGGITQIRATLSGTCNFILERIGQGADLAAAIREAQRNGLAEPDPTLDLSGEDLAHKIVILAWEAFGATLLPDETPVTGIGRFVRERASSREAGRIARLVGTCQIDASGEVTARVRPEWLEASDSLARSRGEEVVCEIRGTGADGGASSAVVRARGAGRWPTAESVMADLLELARRGGAHPAATRPPAPIFSQHPAPSAQHLTPSTLQETRS